MGNFTEEELYKQMAEYNKEVKEHNLQILKDNGISTEDFNILTDQCYVTDKIQIVSEPEGDDECESFGIFKAVYVDQTSTANGDSGDYSYRGHVYGKLANKKWLKVPYAS